MIIGHEALFYVFNLLGNPSQPGQDGIFFMSFHPGQTAHPAAFGDQSQRFQNFVFGGALTIANRAFGFGEGFGAGLTQIALSPSFGLAKLADVGLLLLGGQLPEVWTGFILTEFTDLYNCNHGFLS